MLLNRVQATTHTENQRSQRVLEKLGFQREGILREFYCRDGIYNDQVQFSLLRSEWKKVENIYNMWLLTEQENQMSIQIPSIQTSSLTLRPMQTADAEVLHRIYQSEGVLRYFPNPNPPPLERVQRFVAGQQTHWEKYGYGNWGVLPDGENEIIGWAGLQFLPELDETEVGFLLDRPFWGKGYATTAALASLCFGFEHFNLEHIIALVHPDNLASRRVIEKCGMIYVDTLLLWGIELMRHRFEKE
jgi:ribosomal-protein-alanine N-acetyltransferase